MVILSDKNGCTDSAYHTLVKHINSPIPIVMVSWVENFVFNEELLGIKEFACIDFCEYGWNEKLEDTHLFGKNRYHVTDRYVGVEWTKFHNWIRDNESKIYFKRELLKKDVSDNVRPIEYPCVVEPYQIQSKEKFNHRSVNLFSYWGRSNECRIRVHGEIWNHAFKKGFQPCDNIYYLNHYLTEERGEKWITLWIPHYARIDITNLLLYNNLSKLSLSLPGAGFKCFRTMECPVNSTMIMHRNNFAWSHKWDETNCIFSEPGKEIEAIEEALKNENLYSIYLKGMENVDKYRLKNYIPYLENLINNA